jgi:hypothetical protein
LGETMGRGRGESEGEGEVWAGETRRPVRA